MLSLPIMLQDLLATLLVAAWSYFVVKRVSKLIYEAALSRGYPADSAVYFSRKSIHVLAGGVGAVLLPLAFHEALLPLAFTALFALYIHIMRRRGRLDPWYQQPGNSFEVNFIYMWGISAFIVWAITGSMLLASLPPFFVSIGDGATGIVRNLWRKRREKGVEGSVAMFISILPYSMLGGAVGVASAFVSTVVEKQEALDDNIAIPAASAAMIIAGRLLAPHLLSPLI